MCVSIFSCHKCFRLGGKAAATDWSSCGLPAQCVVGKNKNAISGKQLRVAVANRPDGGGCVEEASKGWGCCSNGGGFLLL